MKDDITAEKITEAESRELRKAFDEVQKAQDILLAVQRKLSVKYVLRGKDEMDPFGYITRDSTLTR